MWLQYCNAVQLLAQCKQTFRLLREECKKEEKKEILLQMLLMKLNLKKKDIEGLNSELSMKKCQVNNDPNSESLLSQLWLKTVNFLPCGKRKVCPPIWFLMNSQNQKQAFQRKFQKLPKASVASMPNTFTSVIAKATTPPTSIFSGHFLSTLL